MWWKKRKTVRALDNSPTNALAFIYDSATGRYFRPYNPLYDTMKELRSKGLGDGTGTIAVLLDTGIMSHHPLLRGKIISSVDLTEEQEGPEDLNGHGTLGALIAITMSLGTRFVNVKVLNKDKEGSESDFIAGLEWVAQQFPNPLRQPVLVNLSLGCLRDRQCDGGCKLCKAAANLVLGNIDVCAAVGNIPGLKMCPAACPLVRDVGALDFSGMRIADYSGPARHYQHAGGVLMVPVE